MRTIELSDAALWHWVQSPCPPHNPALDVLRAIASSNTAAVPSGWSGATQMPSEIHVELLARGRIPDPYKGMNEEVSAGVANDLLAPC